MTVLLPVFKKTGENSQENISILTYIKFLEATVVLLKDYEHINAVGLNIIMFMEQSINQNNKIQLYEQEVNYQKYVILFSMLLSL